jgi:hypothetical protein
MKLLVIGKTPSCVHIHQLRDDIRKERILACDHFDVEWVVILLSGNESYKQVVIYLMVFVAEN